MSEETPQDRPEAEGERPTAPMMINLSDLFGGRRSVHEIGVQGSVIDQTVKLVEGYITPELVKVTEPGTGVEAIGVLGKNGLELLDPSEFDEYRTNPAHRRGTAELLSLDSFVEHVNRFSDADTVIFADNNRSAPSLTAVLDYHPAGAESKARFGLHRSSFRFPLSDEWKAWNAKNAQPMKMVDFAQFLEDRIIDVMPDTLISLTDEARTFVESLGGTNGVSRIADPAKLMQLATGLQIFENSMVSEANKLQSGEAEIKFTSEHVDSAGQKLNIPSLFVIGIPVFKNGPVYQLLSRLRYRKTGGQIVFWYELWRTDRVFDHAFDEAVVRVTADTTRPVYLGRDESKAATH